ncbi:ABC transporter permease [Parafilimonas sp.]|uniref:ABC transporter permease n=1 Tax=Parafilimonas sp. TaxID=1969739 RepID=UPI0039E41A55
MSAVRNMMRYKAFSLLNIMGLALGMACSILILLWVQDEKSVDGMQSKNLYIVYERQFIDNKIDGGYYTPGILANEMKRNIPEIEYASNLSTIGYPDRLTFQAEDKIMKFDGSYADSDYFKMMNYPLLKGNKATALNSPVSLCISEKMAKAFFGSADAAVGKTLRYENRKDLTVSGVFADLPANVTDKFDFVINWATYLEENSWAKEWGNDGPNTLIYLHDNANAKLVDSKIRKFLDNYNKEQTASFRIELHMQPFRDLYLNSNFKDGFITGGRIQYVKLFSIVAVFILLIACINFMNLTTARSAKRAKEIGVRKVAGAIKPVLMRQFLSEALLITAISVVLSLILVVVLLPYFNQLTEKQIAFPYSNVYFWISVVLLTFITGLASGIYPAVFLSSFKPITVLKGTLKFSNGSAFLRKGLVVFQFALSIILITGTIIVSQQIKFIQSINLGYDRENLIYVPVEGELRKQYKVFKEQALNSTGIKSVTRIGETPTNIGSGTGGVNWEGKDPNSSVNFTNTFEGYDFVKTLNLKLVAGRDISKDFASDSAGYLINESALKVIGYKDPVGKPLTFWGQKGTIVGVLKDFHFSSLHDPINPLILRNGENSTRGNILVRTEPGKTKQALASLEKICKDLNPKFPFTYSFSDEEYQKLYKSEQVVSKLSGWFAFLGIFISCLGLLGLAMFTAEQRTKEIGIRKVLGASVTSLFTLLSRDFIVLVVISMAIATPLAWWAMHNWLQDFAYKVPIQMWVFGVAGILAILIALITVSFQAIKAAMANPVKSLRTE